MAKVARSKKRVAIAGLRRTMGAMKKLAFLALAFAGAMLLGACQSTSDANANANGSDSGFHKGFSVDAFGSGAVR